MFKSGKQTVKWSFAGTCQRCVLIRSLSESVEPHPRQIPPLSFYFHDCPADTSFQGSAKLPVKHLNRNQILRYVRGCQWPQGCQFPSSGAFNIIPHNGGRRTNLAALICHGFYRDTFQGKPCGGILTQIVQRLFL